MSKNYSEKTAEVIKAALDEENLHYDFDEDSGTITMSYDANFDIGKIYFEIEINEIFYIVNARTYMNAKTSDYAQVAEYLSRVNFELFRGNFKFDFDDGSFFYSETVCVDDNLTKAEVMDCLIYALNAYDNYANGLMKVITGAMTAKEAFEETQMIDSVEE